MKIESSLPPTNPNNADRALQKELRRLCGEMEAVFLSQLFAAMRETGTRDDPFAPSAGEEIFRGLLDDKIASEAAQRMKHGIGEMLYRQLSRRLTVEEPS